jgi:hypothetical protein
VGEPAGWWPAGLLPRRQLRTHARARREASSPPRVCVRLLRWRARRRRRPTTTGRDRRGAAFKGPSRCSCGSRGPSSRPELALVAARGLAGPWGWLGGVCACCCCLLLLFACCCCCYHPLLHLRCVGPCTAPRSLQRPHHASIAPLSALTHRPTAGCAPPRTAPARPPAWQSPSSGPPYRCSAPPAR